LATGSANGQIKRLFETVTKINEKWGPFDMHLCAGDLFGEQEDSEEIELLIKGDIKVPLDAYFMYGKNEIPSKISERIKNNSGQVCENLSYLEGERGVILTTHGARIAYVNGIPKSSQFDSINGGVDIFLSYEWPKCITRFSNQHNITKDFQNYGSRRVADISLSIKPRYHFATAASKKQLLPLAINQSKETESKWYYGFNLVPFLHLDQTSKIEIPMNITECPLSVAQPKKGKKRDDDEKVYSHYSNESNSEKKYKKQKRGERGPPPEKYVCHICDEPGHWIDECTVNKCIECKQKGHSIQTCPNKKDRPPKELGPCWFCLSNPKVSKHLVVSVGTEVYVAVAKGGLIDTTNKLVSPIIPGGGHVLIISLAHYETFSSASEEVRDKISEEIEKYKESLREMFNHYGANLLTFQVSVCGKRHHAHIQVVPVPIKYDSEFIREKFVKEAKAEGFIFEEGPPLVAEDDSDNDERSKECNFSVELPNVLANLFETPERASWKACSLNQTKEEQDRDQFRSAFKDFDFTLKE
ncbi:6443_t:CDS:10, partial [Ambispora gerdemannii]